MMQLNDLDKKLSGGVLLFYGYSYKNIPDQIQDNIAHNINFYFKDKVQKNNMEDNAYTEEYFDYKEDEIRRMKSDIKKEKEEQQKFDQAAAAAAGSTGGAGNVAPTGPPIAEETQVGIKEEEPVLTNLERLIRKNGASEEESTIFSRILEKQQRKVEPFTD